MRIFDGYLASPYSHKDPTVRHARFRAACLATGWAIKRGLFLYSPIAHTHSVAECCELPLGFDFWEEYDTVGISSCKDLYILKIPGWEESVGVWREINIAEDLGKSMHMVESAGNHEYMIYVTNYATIIGSNNAALIKGRNPNTLRHARAIIESGDVPPMGTKR